MASDSFSSSGPITTASDVIESKDSEIFRASCESESPDKTDELYPTICQYFLKGKCRFGENCFNRHEVSETNETVELENGEISIKNKMEKSQLSKSNKTKKESVESQMPRKKPPMKTATNVINRIQWDEKLKPEDFTVGYLDRFIGVIEDSFNAFDWEDVTSQDQTILAIPRHRIQYFKYKNEPVWDKSKRLDCVFGSTGSEVKIVDVIESLKNKEQSENETNVSS